MTSIKLNVKMEMLKRHLTELLKSIDTGEVHFIEATYKGKIAFSIEDLERKNKYNKAIRKLNHK